MGEERVKFGRDSLPSRQPHFLHLAWIQHCGQSLQLFCQLIHIAIGDDLHHSDRPSGRYACPATHQSSSPTTPILTKAGLVLVASVDDNNSQEVGELKTQIRQVIKRINPNSEPRASIESNKYTMQYVSQTLRLAAATHPANTMIC